MSNLRLSARHCNFSDRSGKRDMDTIGLRPAEAGGDHSWRKARIGSTFMARRAGT
jgi:hypothetical protein